MATFTYRRLDANGDPLMGRGQASFATDLEAVAQAIRTRLLLFSGEWWENRNAGTPVFESMLGATNPQRPEVIALLLKQRILSTPYVTGVTHIETTADAVARVFRFSCRVETRFGTLTLAG